MVSIPEISFSINCTQTGWCSEQLVNLSYPVVSTCLPVYFDNISLFRVVLASWIVDEARIVSLIPNWAYSLHSLWPQAASVSQASPSRPLHGERWTGLSFRISRLKSLCPQCTHPEGILNSRLCSVLLSEDQVYKPLLHLISAKRPTSDYKPLLTKLIDYFMQYTHKWLYLLSTFRQKLKHKRSSVTRPRTPQPASGSL